MEYVVEEPPMQMFDMAAGLTRSDETCGENTGAEKRSQMVPPLVLSPKSSKDNKRV